MIDFAKYDANLRLTQDAHECEKCHSGKIVGNTVYAGLKWWHEKCPVVKPS